MLGDVHMHAHVHAHMHAHMHVRVNQLDTVRIQQTGIPRAGNFACWDSAAASWKQIELIAST